jgi:uncharacterized protein
MELEESQKEFATNYLNDLVERTGIKPVFFSVTGAHLFGFPSEDSDIDIRGVYAHPTDEVLGLEKPKESINKMTDNRMLDLDVKELRTFILGLTNGNGNYFEQINSPHILVSSSDHDQFREIANGLVSKQLHPFYSNFASKEREKALKHSKVKNILYAMRLYMSGSHIFETGNVESNINTLNEDQNYSIVNELVQAKRKGELSTTDITPGILHTLDDLKSNFERSYKGSRLPDVAPAKNIKDIEDFLIRFRRKN